MDPASIAAIISAVAQVAKAAAPVVEQAIHTMNSDDATEIKAALADLQASNDALHERVQAKLRGSS